MCFLFQNDVNLVKLLLNVSYCHNEGQSTQLQDQGAGQFSGFNQHFGAGPFTFGARPFSLFKQHSRPVFHIASGNVNSGSDDDDDEGKEESGKMRLDFNEK